jgi:DNA-binding winged helix-turn-helix (wHTH) protein
MTRREKSSYEFSPFQIYDVERLLTRGRDVVPLPLRAVDTLLVLVAKQRAPGGWKQRPKNARTICST